MACACLDTIRRRFANRSLLFELSCPKKQKKTATNVTVCRLFGSLVVKKRFELYSLVAQVPFAPLVLRTYAPLTVIRHGSNFARLADERALRLGFAALSAPSLARQASDAVAANLSCSKKQKKTATNVTVFFWRSRRDLNSRAGIADLHP